MVNSRIFVSIFCLQLLAVPCLAGELKGRVETKNPLRVRRPAAVEIKHSASPRADTGAAKAKLTGGIDTEKFQLPGRACQSPAGLSSQGAGIGLNGQATSPAAHLSGESGKTAQIPPAIATPAPSAGSPLQAVTSAGKKPPANASAAGGSLPVPSGDSGLEKSDRPVTIRLQKYNRLQDWEVVWEALHMANLLAKRSSDVTLVLDLEGVNAANKHDMREYQLHRQSTERMIQTQKLLRDFIADGGKVYASERWAKFWGLAGGSYPSLTAGVELLTDEELADKYIERSGSIIDY